MKIIHITDPHLVAPGRILWGADTTDRLSRCLDDAARWHGDAEFCVISGDIADAGEPVVYDWVRERLRGFPIRTFLMIGNHDDRDTFRAAFPDIPCDPNGFVQQAHDTPEGVFLFLDTLKGGPGAGSEGRFCADRRAWLRQRLAEASGRPVYIFMHHPPCDVGIPRMDRIKIEEPEEFAGVLAAGGNIRHIFFGHVHRACFVNWRGIPCTALPGTNHQVPLVHGSVGSPYSREPAMYSVILVEGASTVVHFDACLDRSDVECT